MFVVPPQQPRPAVMTALVVLGVVCTGATLVLFYTLIAHVFTWLPGEAALNLNVAPS